MRHVTIENTSTMKIESGKITFSQREAGIAIGVAILLVSVVFTIISKTNAENRDSERITHMTNIRKALRLYKINSGHFPLSLNPVIITGSDTFSQALLNDLLVREVFTDPVHPEFMYTYQSDPSGNKYNLRFCLETDIVVNYTKGCDNIITP